MDIYRYMTDENIWMGVYVFSAVFVLVIVIALAFFLFDFFSKDRLS